MTARSPCTPDVNSADRQPCLAPRLPLRLLHLRVTRRRTRPQPRSSGAEPLPPAALYQQPFFLRVVCYIISFRTGQRSAPRRRAVRLTDEPRK